MRETTMCPIVRSGICLLAVVFVLSLNPASAQINFEKTGYYLSLGDSVAAGEGALPVTRGFVYRLYEHGVFGPIQNMDFGNIAIKGVTSDEVQMLQAPQAVCVQPPRIAVAPSVITLSAGANDFRFYLASSMDDMGVIPKEAVDAIPEIADQIAEKVANIIGFIVFGDPGLPEICAREGIPDVTVLVSNYYRFNHPDPVVDSILNLALDCFDESLRERIAQLRFYIAMTGRTARIGYVDTLSAMEGEKGLLLIEKRNGYDSGNPFDFEIHPTNAGHRVIAEEFRRVWEGLQ